MTTIQQMHPRYSIGFQDDKATAANAALWAGQEIFEDSRKVWDSVREVAAMGPIEEVAEQSALLRRHANVLAAAAGKTLGLVSSSACGLWGIEADSNRIFEVESTDGGSEYLTQVRFVRVTDLTSGVATPTMERYADEFPIRQVLAFFDSYEAAHAFREPRTHASRFPR
jgi:hypothetical protein